MVSVHEPPADVATSPVTVTPAGRVSDAGIADAPDPVDVVSWVKVVGYAAWDTTYTAAAALEASADVARRLRALAHEVADADDGHGGHDAHQHDGDQDLEEREPCVVGTIVTPQLPSAAGGTEKTHQRDVNS